MYNIHPNLLWPTFKIFEIFTKHVQCHGWSLAWNSDIYISVSKIPPFDTDDPMVHSISGKLTNVIFYVLCTFYCYWTKFWFTYANL